MRQIITCLGIAGVLVLAGMGLRRGSGPATESERVFEPSVAELRLAQLEGEQTPYFSRDVRYNGVLKTEEILLYRKDHSIARLFYKPDGTLREVRCYRVEGDVQQLAYQAEYDKAGRRIAKALYYDHNGYVETRFERKGAEEVYLFCRDGHELKSDSIAADGTQTSTVYAEGQAPSVTVQAPPPAAKDLVFWDAPKTRVRLRVQMQGARLKSWEYLASSGKSEHRGEVLADGSLKFEFLENGKVKRTQLWKLVGEDWERCYYGLFYSELLADDGKTVEHKVWVRSNGSLKSHERYNGKTGQLEMHRDFDVEGRVERVEDFNARGQIEKLWVFPPSETRSRGFVPTGMRDYPGEDKNAGNVYNLDGMPFSHSVLDRHPWAFINLTADK